MDTITEYRNSILEFLKTSVDKNGTPRLTEAQAVSLANELSDEELEEGMDFNTPEEVAELLLESGLE